MFKFHFWEIWNFIFELPTSLGLGQLCTLSEEMWGMIKTYKFNGFEQNFSEVRLILTKSPFFCWNFQSFFPLKDRLCHLSHHRYWCCCSKVSECSYLSSRTWKWLRAKISSIVLRRCDFSKMISALSDFQLIYPWLFLSSTSQFKMSNVSCHIDYIASIDSEYVHYKRVSVVYKRRYPIATQHFQASDKSKFL